MREKNPVWQKPGVKSEMRASVIKNFSLSVLILGCVFGFSYWYPRFLVSLLGEKSVWISFLYTYGTGSIFFFLSIFWIFTRRGIDPMRRREELFWLMAICCGFAFMFSCHALWIFFAENFPIKN